MARTKRIPATTASEQLIRDQEVLRALRELAAYFKGARTEREARAALKIIKAFVRDRERTPAAGRAPLPTPGKSRRGRAGTPSPQPADHVTALLPRRADRS